MEGAKFLENRYKLNADPVVESAARKTRRTTGESVPQNADVRIENYIARLEGIFNPPLLNDHPDFDRAQRNLQVIKPTILDKFATKFEEIPESYWRGQVGILRERGQLGDYNRFSEEEKNKWKKELIEGLIDDQRASLEQWVDYLASPDLIDVPTYVKYWVFRSIVGLSEYDKEKRAYPERSKGTVRMFPDINAEALGYVMDALLKKHRNLPISFDMFDEYLPADQREKLEDEFIKGLDKENFAKLYAWANEQIKPVPEQEMPITAGKWVMYGQGSDHKPLVASIRGRGTGWCTAGESFAHSQLEGGDFYVYYSEDRNGNPVNPRIAIRIEGGQIAEVRGIAARQNLDQFMGDVLSKKLEEFPDRDVYLKKERDMKHLTEIDRKVVEGEDLSREDLVFLYEREGIIEGFGYETDPRIKEIRNKRDLREDLAVLYECHPEEIARDKSEVNQATKIYVGKLFPQIFAHLPEGIEEIYTEFPDRRIPTQKLVIGGYSPKDLLYELDNWAQVSNTAASMIQNPQFHTEDVQAKINLVYLRPFDLGLRGWQHSSIIFAKAKSLGLELCPAEAGPYFAIEGIMPPDFYSIEEEDEESFGEFEVILAMDPIRIRDRFGNTDWFFGLDGNGIRGVNTIEGDWDPSTPFAFKIKSQI